MTRPFVEIDQVAMRYGGVDGTLALEGCSMNINQGEFVAVVGPSGCGKSTLMRLVTGLWPATEGNVVVAGQEVDGPLSIAGMAFQAPTLLPWRRILSNVMLPLEVTPQHRDNFLKLVREGFYDSTLFHRVIPGFMIQGGGYTTGLVRRAGLAPIVLESNKGLSNLRGTVAMARTNVANSATSEFFINLVDNTFLDYRNEGSPGYAVFGKVTQGQEVVDAIGAKETGVLNGFADVPLEEITITLALQSR